MYRRKATSVEAGYIQRYQTNRGMLSDEDKHYRARRYNRQHGRHHEEPEKRQTATNIPSQRKRNVYNLVRTIERVDNKKAASIIARLGKRKLQDVQHTTTLERIRQQCIQARVNLQKGHIPANKQIVFNFQLHRKVNPRKIIMQDCPFPPNVKKFVRIRNKLNPIFLTRNCHHDAMHLDEELSHATCMCASLRTSTNTKHFRADDKGEYHLATNDPDVLKTFLQSQGIQQNHYDEFCMVWKAGVKFRQASTESETIRDFAKSFADFEDDIMRHTKANERPTEGACTNWKQKVLQRFKQCMKQRKNYIVSKEAASVFRIVHQHFEICPVDKNPQAVGISCKLAYLNAIKKILASSDYKTFNPADPSDPLAEHKLTHINQWYHGTPMWDNWNYEWAGKALEAIVKNQIYCVNGHLLQQVKGLGMGNEPAAPASSLTLAAKEMTWVDKILERYGNEYIHNTCNDFKSVCRYIDDRAEGIAREALPTSADYHCVLLPAGSSNDEEGVDFRCH